MVLWFSRSLGGASCRIALIRVARSVPSLLPNIALKTSDVDRQAPSGSQYVLHETWLCFQTCVSAVFTSGAFPFPAGVQIQPREGQFFPSPLLHSGLWVSLYCSYLILRVASFTVLFMKALQCFPRLTPSFLGCSVFFGFLDSGAAVKQTFRLSLCGSF